jgi:hypothetical protein
VDESLVLKQDLVEAFQIVSSIHIESIIQKVYYNFSTVFLVDVYGPARGGCFGRLVDISTTTPFSQWMKA